MKIPVCIISHNRALYLDSLMETLREELNDIDVIIVDNGSKESLMKEVLNKWRASSHVIRLSGDNWINDEYKAKNSFLEYCKNSYKEAESYLFLQDDMQYVGPKKQLKNIIKDLEKSQFLNVSLTGVRRSTIQSTYSNRRIRNVWQIKDNHFGTTGLYRKEVFDSLGFYSQNFPLSKEFWGRGEDDYHERVVSHYGSEKNISAYAHIPVFAGVWNDPRGNYSFLREGLRYGNYIPPVHPHNSYYENMTQEKYENLLSRSTPASFVDIAVPLGWEYAKNKSGDQEKYPQNKIMEEGPVCEIT
jgi:glycosyltransferase involved in cell wall biosynthesis